MAIQAFLRDGDGDFFDVPADGADHIETLPPCGGGPVEILVGWAGRAVLRRDDVIQSAGSTPWRLSLIQLEDEDGTDEHLPGGANSVGGGINGVITLS